MSVTIFPSSLKGLGIEVQRAPQWGTIVQENVSGKETRIGLMAYPRYEWEVHFNFLRSSTALLEMQTLFGFFNARQGMYDSFLFTDPDDYTIAGQTLGVGNGATRNFSLVRAFGSFVEPVLAPNTVSAVYKSSVVAASSTYTVTNWGTTLSQGPGVVQFTTASIPTSTMTISADFTYYFPVRFSDDNMPFDRFMNLLYETKKVTFKSIK